MKRYAPLLTTSLLLVICLVLGTAYLARSANRPLNRKRLPGVTVYTTQPAETVAMLAAEYERSQKVRLDFVALDPESLLARLRSEGKQPQADAVLADSPLLERATREGAFVPFYSELSDSVATPFKSADDAWVGLWYDPVVFCANSDYLATQAAVPRTWDELAASPARLGMTDFLAADAAANLLLSLVTERGDAEAFRLLRACHPNVVQYVKFLSTPVRMAGMGEVDVAVAVQSEALRYISDGYPLRLVYPADGTAYLLTGAALLRDDKPAAVDLLNWLLSDEAQLALQRENRFFVPTNQATLAYKMLSGKDLRLFPHRPQQPAALRRQLLDRWVKEVRLNQRS